MDHFAVIEKLCRTALIMSGEAPEVRRQVAHLKNALERQAAVNGGASPAPRAGGGRSAGAAARGGTRGRGENDNPGGQGSPDHSSGHSPGPGPGPGHSPGHDSASGLAGRGGVGGGGVGGGAGARGQESGGEPGGGGDSGARAAETLRRQALALEGLLGRGAGAQPLPASGDPPTPQTRARLGQDPVRHMLGKGTLQREHADAAKEIRDVFEAVTAGLFASARRLDVEEVISGAQRRAFRQPVERLPERLGVLWRRRYKPWAEAVDGIKVGVTRNARWSALGLVIAVLVDGRSLHGIDRELKLRRGTAAAHFRGALHRYCVVAGTIRPRLTVAAVAAAERGEPGGNGGENGGDSGHGKGGGEGRGPGHGQGSRYQASCGCGARFAHLGRDEVVACPHCGESRALAAALEEGA